MSDKNIDDIDKRRLDWSGSERFSDRCANENCGHSRADHLSRNQLRPLGGGDCKVVMCVIDSNDHEKHTNATCVLGVCPCSDENDRKGWKVL